MLAIGQRNGQRRKKLEQQLSGGVKIDGWAGGLISQHRGDGRPRGEALICAEKAVSSQMG